MQSDQKSYSTLFPDERQCGETVLRSIQLVELRILKVVDFICSKHRITYWLDGGTLLGAVRHKGFIPWDDDIDIVMPRKDFDKFISLCQLHLPKDIELDATEKSIATRRYNVPCRLRDRHSKIIDAYNDDNHQRGIFIDIFPSDFFHTSGPLLLLEKSAKFLYRNLLNIHSPPLRGISYPPFVVNRILDAISPLVTAETPIKYFHRFVRKFLVGSKFQQRGRGLIGYGFDVRWTRIFRPEHIYPLKRMSFEDAEFPVPNDTDAVLKVFYGANYLTPPPPEKRGDKHFSSVVLDTRISQEPVFTDEGRSG
jgi:lipopolysaccharide cholinephosphotransferase